jgi:AraC family transcriptional regulator of arabinose operon
VGRGLFALHLHDAAYRARAESAFATLHRDQASNDALSSELALNGLEAVLLLGARDSAAARGVIDSRVRQALELVAADLTAPHTPASLASAVALSPSRLAHLIRAETGESIGEAVLGLRLRQAARLLAFTTRGVAAIAEDVGFNSAYYFSRQFRRRFGVSPRAYRVASGWEHPNADPVL